MLRMFLIFDLVRIFNIEFVGTCIIYLSTKFHMPDSNGSLVIVIKPKAVCRFRASAIFFSYILPKKK
jgi:hypothetical protein